jgi:hypothetical protein
MTAIAAWPVLRHPGARLFGTTIVGRHADPFTVMVQFAAPPMLGPYTQPLTDWVGVALARLVSPVVAFNALVLVTFPLAAAAAAALAQRTLALPTAAAVVAGLAFAFSPFHIAQSAYHAHIAQIEWIPVYWLALLIALRDATPLRLVLLLGAALAVCAASDYLGLIAAALTPIAIAAAAASDPDARRPRDVGRVIAALAIAALAAIAWSFMAAPEVWTTRRAFDTSDSALRLFGARWWAYLLPPVDHPILGRQVADVWTRYGIGDGLLEQQLSIGVGLMLLAAAAIVAWARDTTQPNLRAVPLFTILAGAALLCSLSPSPPPGSLMPVRPSELLHALAPMFRAYARFGVVAQLAVALLAAAGAAQLWRAGHLGRATVVALLVLTAFEYDPLRWRWYDVLPTSGHRWLADHGGRRAVFECGERSAADAATAWLAGYRIDYVPDVTPDCSLSDVAAAADANGLHFVLVRAGAPDAAWLAHGPTRHLEPRFRAADAIVFAVAAGASAPYVASTQNLYPTEHDGTRRWSWSAGRPAVLVIENRRGVSARGTFDMQLASFAITRHVTVMIDGQPVATFAVDSTERHYRLPLDVHPGANRLQIASAEPPVAPAALHAGADVRPLSIVLGDWQWSDDAR